MVVVDWFGTRVFVEEEEEDGREFSLLIEQESHTQKPTLLLCLLSYLPCLDGLSWQVELKLQQQRQTNPQLYYKI